MGFNRMDKITALTTLRLNGGNKLKTAQEIGVNRKTLIAWERQLQSDMRMLGQVDVAVKNLANLEELNAVRAGAEIGRRLDSSPENIRDADLVKIKDSGISNARLIRGQPTQIVEQKLDPEVHALEFLRILLAKTNGDLSAALSAFRQASLAPLVSDFTRDRVADQVEASPKLLTDA